MGFLQGNDYIISLLYVEDEPIARTLLHNLISRKYPTMKIYTAENGRIGLEMFTQIRPDIVLTDIDLPLLDGMSMASEMRRIDPCAEIMILSGQDKALHDSDCKKNGFIHYFQKPVCPEELYGAIADSLFRITSSQRNLEASVPKVVEC